MKLVFLVGLFFSASVFAGEYPLAAQATADQNPLCQAAYPFYWVIGDASGNVVDGVEPSGQTTITASTIFDIASASKLFYATYVVQMHGGVLSATDIGFLHFASGYNNMGDNGVACLNYSTAAACLASNPRFTKKTPQDVGAFDYDSGQDENDACSDPTLNICNLNTAKLSTTISTELMLSPPINYSEVLFSGGVHTNATSFAAFLRNIVNGTYYINALLGTSPVCTFPGGNYSNVGGPASCNAIFSPIAQNWHYSLGHWVEDDPLTNGDGAFSSPGAKGFYPWISADHSTYGILARNISAGNNNESQGNISIQCGRLIRYAFLNNVVQTGSLPGQTVKH